MRELTQTLWETCSVAPLLLGILLGAIVALISLVPSLLKFSETPLGRFLLLVEMVSCLLLAYMPRLTRPGARTVHLPP